MAVLRNATFHSVDIYRKIQKEPPEVFYEESYSYKVRNIQKETLLFESLFNKVAGLKA